MSTRYGDDESANMKHVSFWFSKLFSGFILLGLVSCNHLESGSSGSSTSAAVIDQTFGVYYWSGVPDSPFGSQKFAAGLKSINSEGFRSVRIAINPAALTAYGFDTPSCGTTSYLKCALEQTPLKSTLLSSPSQLIFMTAYDGVSSVGGNQFLNDTFMMDSANQAAITAEMKDFAYSLFSNFANSGKTFILTTWEGDNQIYCASSYGYVNSTAGKTACDSQLSTSGLGTVDNVVDAFTLWHQARKAGIDQARALAAANGLSGVTVLSGIEGNSVNMLFDAGFKSVFRDVVPVVNPDVVLYSSYESLDNGLQVRDVTTQLITDVTTIRTVTGAQKLYLGEVGYAVSTFGNATAQSLTVEAIAAVRTMKTTGLIDGAILWQFFEPPSEDQPGYGLYESTGVARPLEAPVKAALLNHPYSVAPDINMFAVANYGSSNTLTSVTGIYGSFPFSDITGITTDCGITPVLAGQNGLYLTITYPAMTTDKVCHFQVVRSSGVSALSPPLTLAGGPVIGPTAVVANGTPDTSSYLSIYGNFQTASPIVVTSSCAGMTVTQTYSSLHQINVQVPSTSADQTCTFSLSADGDSATIDYTVPATLYMDITALVLQSALDVVNISAYGYFITPATGTVTALTCGGATATVTAWQSGLVNFYIPASTSDRTCTFQTVYDSTTSNVSSSFAVPGNITITGTSASTAFDGVSRIISVYGYFGAATGTASTVDASTCAGAPTISSWSTNQVNIAVPKSASARTCAFTLTASGLTTGASDNVAVPADL